MIGAYISAAEAGFSTLSIDESTKKSALYFLEQRLTDDQFEAYVPQILSLIDRAQRDVLVDSFYRLLPFGTAGRRGLVGIGPNRINDRSVRMSAQGHSDYLRTKRGEEAFSKGIVIGYDTRVFVDTSFYDASLPNPVYGLSGKLMAEYAAQVYAVNGIHVYLMPTVCPTPEVSFLVRHLGAMAGEVFSASHNPPEYNGEKIQNHLGGQVIPPDDQLLIEILEKVQQSPWGLPLEQGIKQGLIQYVTDVHRQTYRDFLQSCARTEYRSAIIYFSAFHGTALHSVYPILTALGFSVYKDEDTCTPDPLFRGLPKPTPNPELEAMYQPLEVPARGLKADIILVTDPDADRIGCMSREGTTRRYYTGNEIAILVWAFILRQYKKTELLEPSHTVVTTMVTTVMLRKLSEAYGVQTVDDLLVGIKYIADIMDQYDAQQKGKDILLGAEESHGLTMHGLREKDATFPAIMLSECASRCKETGTTLGAYLDGLYEKHGYVYNTQFQISLPGAQGMSQMAALMRYRRVHVPEQFGDFSVIRSHDMQEGVPVVSETDKTAKNVLVWRCSQIAEQGIDHIKLTIRPSGTEPKIKVYCEISLNSEFFSSLPDQKRVAKQFADELGTLVLAKAKTIIASL